MIDHHLQKSIMGALINHESLRFAELRPPEIDGNIFTYHLHQLIKQKMVTKNPDGSYSLTSDGKLASINLHLGRKEMLEQAHNIFLIALRDKDDTWLLRRRTVHPQFGKLGFLHGEPTADKSLEKAASARLLDKTGLAAKLSVRGYGYVKIFHGDELDSFVSFCLLYGDKPNGELLAKDETGENAWIHNPDFTSDEMIPSMPDLVKHLAENSNLFFADLTYNL